MILLEEVEVQSHPKCRHPNQKWVVHLWFVYAYLSPTGNINMLIKGVTSQLSLLSSIAFLVVEGVVSFCIGMDTKIKYYIKLF